VPMPLREGLTALPNWRITCFSTGKGLRRCGVADAALGGARAEIAGQGGGTVEGYPEETDDLTLSGSFLYTGPRPPSRTTGHTYAIDLPAPLGGHPHCRPGLTRASESARACPLDARANRSPRIDKFNVRSSACSRRYGGDPSPAARPRPARSCSVKPSPPVKGFGVRQDHAGVVLGGDGAQHPWVGVGVNPNGGVEPCLTGRATCGDTIAVAMGCLLWGAVHQTRLARDL